MPAASRSVASKRSTAIPAAGLAPLPLPGSIATTMSSGRRVSLTAPSTARPGDVSQAHLALLGVDRVGVLPRGVGRQLEAGGLLSRRGALGLGRALGEIGTALL